MAVEPNCSQRRDLFQCARARCLLRNKVNMAYLRRAKGKGTGRMLRGVREHDAVRQVKCLAFGQDGEARIVDALRAGGHAPVSLIAEIGGQVVGHIMFSVLTIVTNKGELQALALAPMAVLPEYQRMGIGSALVRRGLQECKDQGHRIVVVLGHADFYPRLGFSQTLAERLASPYGSGPSHMATELAPGALSGVAGKLV